MNLTRTSVFVVILFYLVGLGFLLSAIAEDISLGNIDSTSQSFGNSFSFLGFKFTVGDSIFGNIVVSISILPIWFNSLFIVIPSILLIYFGIMMWIPTIPSG